MNERKKKESESKAIKTSAVWTRKGTPTKNKKFEKTKAANRAEKKPLSK